MWVYSDMTLTLMVFDSQIKAYMEFQVGVDGLMDANAMILWGFFPPVAKSERPLCFGKKW